MSLDNGMFYPSGGRGPGSYGAYDIGWQHTSGGPCADSPLLDVEAGPAAASNRYPERIELLRAVAALGTSERQLLRVELASNFAEDGHAGQKRESGADYVSHSYGVALILVKEARCADVNTIIAALIHDTPEDSPIFTNLIQKGIKDPLEDPYKIVRECITSGFGVYQNAGVEVAEITLALTKLPKRPDLTDEDRQTHHVRAIWNSSAREKAIVCKECDVLHNLRTIDAKSDEGIARVLDKTKRHYIPLFEAAAEKHPTFWKGAISNLLELIHAEIEQIEKRHPQPA